MQYSRKPPIAPRPPGLFTAKGSPHDMINSEFAKAISSGQQLPNLRPSGPAPTPQKRNIG